MTPTISAKLYFLAPYHIAIQEEPLPALQPDQVLVQTIVSAISPGTEMLFYRGQAPTDLSIDATMPTLAGQIAYPLQYGYACVGRVINCGATVDTAWRERLVFAFQPHASYFVTTPAELLLIPSGIEPEQAALLPNMETAVNFVMDGQPMIGERVVVFGQGVVGLLTTALLARFPLAELFTVEAHPLRREQARAFGATQTLAPHQLGQLEADLIYEVSGNPAALDQAIAAAGFGGRVVIGSWYGQKSTTLNLGGAFHRSRIKLISSQVSSIAPEWAGRWDKRRRLDVAWSMLAQLATQRLITQRFAFSAAAQAYALVDQHPEQTLQVLLTYPAG